jgi:hypothetical protein
MTPEGDPAAAAGGLRGCCGTTAEWRPTQPACHCADGCGHRPPLRAGQQQVPVAAGLCLPADREPGCVQPLADLLPGRIVVVPARNRRLVLACLNITDEPHAGEPDEELEQDDLDPLGLKALPVHVGVILADPADRARVGGLRHLSAPLPEVDALPVHPEVVLIVENKESAYLFPDRPRTVVVHSLGNHLNVLDEIGWLEGAHHLYWGDLDRAGFTLLSRARTRLPRLVSVLMNPVTLEAHRTLAV